MSNVNGMDFNKTGNFGKNEMNNFGMNQPNKNIIKEKHPHNPYMNKETIISEKHDKE